TKSAYVTALDGWVSNPARLAAAVKAATTPVTTGPNRSPAQAVSKEPATAPRFNANRKAREEPRLTPDSLINCGSQVPKPYQANKLANVVTAIIAVSAKYVRENRPSSALSAASPLRLENPPSRCFSNSARSRSPRAR